MRIASTASPISGAAVRLKMIEHAATTARGQAVDLIQSFWRLKRAARQMAANAELHRLARAAAVRSLFRSAHV